MRLLHDPAAIWAARLALAAVFALAAFAKLRALHEFVGVVHNYRVLPEGLVRPVAYGLPPLEAAIALGLMIEPTRMLAASGATVLLLVFGIAMGVNLVRGRVEIDCGCFASALKQRISWSLVARNLVLIGLALLVLRAPLPARTLTWLDLLTVGAAALGAVLLYIAFTQLRSLAPQVPPRPEDARP
ncbi:MAG: MauE/DoxX family redox-associated membrane protein [Geminicoccaceae bacterium]